MARKSRTSNRLPHGLRDEIFRHLSELGFASSTARIKPLEWNEGLGLVSFATRAEGSRKPYLAVVVREQGPPPACS